MTDISVIKKITSVAVWRIYPSWVNEKLRAWEGLGHSGMFWARLSRDDFRSKLENISFLSRVMFISKSFSVSRAFVRFGAKRSSSGAFGFDDALELFLKTPLCLRAILRTLNMTTRFFLKISFIFSKQSRCHLPDSCGDLQAEQSTFVMERRKLEWKLDFRTLARSSAEGSSIIVAIGTSRLRWFMVQKRKKKHSEVRVWLREVSTLHRLQNQRVLGACFGEPMSLPFCTSLFSCTLTHSCRSVRLQRRVRAKTSSHPWHFRCWSPKRNELECTDLVPLDSGITPFFVTWCNYRCWFCVRKALWRWFYPRSRKRDHFQTLATRVPNLKT